MTLWQWVAYARELRGADANQQRIWELAACLYVACGWYVNRGRGTETFIGREVPTRGWALIGLMTEDFLESIPDHALTRGVWEKRRNERAQQ